QRMPLEAVSEHALILQSAPESMAVLAARHVVGDPLAAVHAATYSLAAVQMEAWREELAIQCDLVRCLFGNPFHPSRLETTWLRHERGAVVNLARVIHDEARFADLPILADALEDAGCTDEQLLNHCREPGVHARGCWAVDLLLGSL